MLHDTLFFGTDMPGGVVTREDWAHFLDDTVTPRFPEGLSVWDASGQWRAGNGGIVHEASRVLELVHRDDQASNDAVSEIATAYKQRFRQEAVLRVRTSACMSL